MSATSTVSCALRITIRSRSWALVSGKVLAADVLAAEGLAAEERCCAAASAAAAGAPTATPPAAAAGTPAGTGGCEALRFSEDSVGADGAEADSALQATPPRTTTTAARAARRDRRRAKRVNMSF